MSSIKLVMGFGTTDGSKTVSLNYAKSSVSPSQVKTLMQAFITNGTIFEAQPLTMRSAKLVTTSETPFDLS